MQGYFTERVGLADPDALARLATEAALDESEARGSPTATPTPTRWTPTSPRHTPSAPTASRSSCSTAGTASPAPSRSRSSRRPWPRRGPSGRRSSSRRPRATGHLLRPGRLRRLMVVLASTSRRGCRWRCARDALDTRVPPRALTVTPVPDADSYGFTGALTVGDGPVEGEPAQAPRPRTTRSTDASQHGRPLSSAHGSRYPAPMLASRYCSGPLAAD